MGDGHRCDSGVSALTSDMPSEESLPEPETAGQEAKMLEAMPQAVSEETEGEGTVKVREASAPGSSDRL